METQSRFMICYNWECGSQLKVTAVRQKISFRCDKVFKIRLWWWMQNSTNILKATKLYTFSRNTFWYMNYISVKLLFKKISYYFFTIKHIESWVITFFCIHSCFWVQLSSSWDVSFNSSLSKNMCVLCLVIQSCLILRRHGL